MDTLTYLCDTHYADISESSQADHGPANSHDRCAAGARVAGFYRSHGKALLRRAQAFLRDTERAQDALHEAFIRLLQSEVDLESLEHPFTWMCRVVDRACLDFLRRERRSPTQQAVEFDEACLALPTEDTSAAEDLERRDLVEKTLTEMDATSHRIARLYFGEGESQELIAQKLGYSRVTINKRIQTIRKTWSAAHVYAV